MFEKNTFENNVVPFKSKEKKTTLEILLQEQDVKDFFRFVNEHDLRLAALEALKIKLSVIN